MYNVKYGILPAILLRNQQIFKRELMFRRIISLYFALFLMTPSVFANAIEDAQAVIKGRWLQVLSSPYFAREMSLVNEALPVLWREKKPDDILDLLLKPSAYPRDGKNHTIFSIPIDGGDEKNREALAEIYLFLVKNLPAKSSQVILQKIFFRLYRDLPDTQAAAIALNMEQMKLFVPLVVLNDDLARARSLMRFNRNAEVIGALEHRIEGDLAFTNEMCEAKYLVGKAHRQMRNYDKAESFMQNVYTHCSGEHQRNALFLIARLAAMRGNLQSLEIFDRYLKEYPQQANALDVLLWKIGAQTALGQLEAAEQTRQILIAKNPLSEPAQEALFREAFDLAWLQPDLALQKLEAIGQNPKIPFPYKERAAYWHARLQVYPNKNFILNPVHEQRVLGEKELADIATKNPGHYYGVMANLLLNQLHEGLFPNFSVIPNATPSQKLLSENPYIIAAQQMTDAKLIKPAVILLDSIAPSIKSRDEKMELVRLYWQTGRLDRSHQTMRIMGLTYPNGIITPENKQMWQYAYPDAFADEITIAAQKASLPSDLLFGLVREESFFDAGIISWAGAIGLCQLTPTTADDEAKLQGMSGLILPQIREAKTNTLLGANHLARHIKNLGHPLLGIAAYNGGPKSVRQWLTREPETRAIDVFVEKIPFKETRKYVKRVVSAWATYNMLHRPSEITFSLNLNDI